MQLENLPDCCSRTVDPLAAWELGKFPLVTCLMFEIFWGRNSLCREEVVVSRLQDAEDPVDACWGESAKDSVELEDFWAVPADIEAFLGFDLVFLF